MKRTMYWTVLTPPAFFKLQVANWKWQVKGRKRRLCSASPRRFYPYSLKIYKKIKPIQKVWVLFCERVTKRSRIEVRVSKSSVEIKNTAYTPVLFLILLAVHLCFQKPISQQSLGKAPTLRVAHCRVRKYISIHLHRIDRLLPVDK